MEVITRSLSRALASCAASSVRQRRLSSSISAWSFCRASATLASHSSSRRCASVAIRLFRASVSARRALLSDKRFSISCLSTSTASVPSRWASPSPPRSAAPSSLPLNGAMPETSRMKTAPSSPAEIRVRPSAESRSAMQAPACKPYSLKSAITADISATVGAPRVRLCVGGGGYRRSDPSVVPARVTPLPGKWHSEPSFTLSLL
mmetsp:Transcript_56384/g.145165  ORF Transcript_56384/g.145165 Transcript_56384/m.145165 type:complete len:205 (+) Transcript_56384:1779-2393(+)